MKRPMFLTLAVLTVAALSLGAGAVLAGQRDGQQGQPPHPQNGHQQAHSSGSGQPHPNDFRAGYQMDGRYHHDRYYPPQGYIAPQLPHQHHEVRYGNNHYYYGGGVWYRPYGPRYAVIAPPIGLAVDFLPDAYTTLWYGAMPYYYANSIYYTRSIGAPGYVVAEAPTGQPDRTEATVDKAGEDFFMYPRNGQGADQQASDRYDCHLWAVQQTGFDPSLNGGGVRQDEAGVRRADYLRAISACLDARGYTVR
jgi:hypothetical protein